MNRSLIVVSFALVATSIQLLAADYLPLSTGNQWSYRNTAVGATFTVSVGAMQEMNGKTYHTLTGYADSPLLVRTNEFGNIVYFDENLATDILLTSFEIAPGDYFVARHRLCNDSIGQVAEHPVIHDGPAGPWEAMQIAYKNFCADAGIDSEQYVQNIGMVRRVITTIAGPRTFDLVSARVGNQVIEAGRFGGFSVSVLPGAAPGVWLATLRIEENSASGIKLRFASSQEYDLRLRDADGNTLWLWSADKSFAQARHERQVNGSWRLNESVPQPLVISGAVQTLTLEAWLTVSSGEPQWAASTVLNLPPQSTAKLGQNP